MERAIKDLGKPIKEKVLGQSRLRMADSGTQESGKLIRDLVGVL